MTDKIVNDQLQNALANAINGFSSSVANAGEKAIAFAQEQVPDVIYQYISWGLIRASLLSFVFLLLFIWYCVVLYKANKSGDEDQKSFTFIFLGAFWGTPSAFLTVYFLLEGLQIYIAPKVWLIEQAASLIK